MLSKNKMGGNECHFPHPASVHHVLQVRIYKARKPSVAI
uniref:Uncharacterized protein n=1 Tax=Anguilla anguilla TaxID=7936 RepID=A0A0E9T9A3_ANGAN